MDKGIGNKGNLIIKMNYILRAALIRAKPILFINYDQV